MRFYLKTVDHEAEPSYTECMAYTAVVLSRESHELLLSKFAKDIPDHWERIAHHLTINMGRSDEGPAKHLLGETVEMTVVSLAKNAKVIAVGVETACPSTNERKHVTIAVNRLAGGKPFHSNKLEKWEPIEPFKISGVVAEEKQ